MRAQITATQINQSCLKCLVYMCGSKKNVRQSSHEHVRQKSNEHVQQESNEHVQQFRLG
jgi:hypothetical protein